MEVGLLLGLSHHFFSRPSGVTSSIISGVHVVCKILRYMNPKSPLGALQFVLPSSFSSIRWGMGLAKVLDISAVPLLCSLRSQLSSALSFDEINCDY